MPDQSWVPVWSHFGLILVPSLVPFWSQFGPSLVLVWSQSGPSLNPTWSQFGPSLVPVWLPSKIQTLGPLKNCRSRDFLQNPPIESSRNLHPRFCHFFTHAKSKSLLLHPLPKSRPWDPSKIVDLAICYKFHQSRAPETFIRQTW